MVSKYTEKLINEIHKQAEVCYQEATNILYQKSFIKIGGFEVTEGT